MDLGRIRLQKGLARSCYVHATFVTACMLGTHAHENFMLLIDLIVNNESIMYYFYSLIEYYTLI